MEGLPFLPGNSFKDPSKSRYHRNQTLGYNNGYAHQKRPELAVGGEPLQQNQLSQQELDELANYKPTLTYGQTKQAPPEDFIPAHVAWDKKVLRFYGFFKQTVHESPAEFYRVRPVVLYYYLEDDSIAVIEPPRENSGMPQGKLIKRQRLPKNDVGDHWHWKDINNNTNVVFYGKVFHITDCDKFTKDFLESEGIVVNEPSHIPEDPYLTKRAVASEIKTYETPSSFDKLKQFVELDRKVLRFFCVWDDRDAMFGELRPLVLHYYLVDDTMELREVHRPNDGRDPFPVLIGRHKVPVNRSELPSSFPSIAMEISSHEVKQYFTPRDLALGKTVLVYGRKLLPYECDNFTKAFYYKHFGLTDFDPVDVSVPRKALPKMEIPPHNGLGSLEDSLQSCLSLVPQPPKKDFIKMMENDHKVLRFEAIMDSIKAEDQNRRFIISYRLADDMVTIYEPQGKNSGIIGGKFLERTRIAKPDSSPEKPSFYGPDDFFIGAMVEVFKQRFVITNADDFVLSYMESHPTQFSASSISNLRDSLGQSSAAAQSQQSKAQTTESHLVSSTGDTAQLVYEVKCQLKKIAITGKNRIDELFLRYDRNRSGHIERENLREMCKAITLPVDDTVLDALVRECTNNPEGKISLEEFRTFFESY